MKKSPAFQFYPSDFLSDENQMVMELAEAGAYIRLMCVCWKEGSIPTDLRRMGKLCGATPKEMAALWPALEPCFDPHPGDPSRLVHPRLEKERAKQAAHKAKKKEAGKKGADARWGDRSATAGDGTSHATATDVPMANDSPSGGLQFSPSGLGTSTHGRVDVVEKSSKPAYTRGELLGEARTVCGLNKWARDEESRANSVLVSWYGEGVPPERIYAAIHGARALVDAGEVDWIKPRTSFGLRALRNQFTLANQGDGRAQRPFFDVAAEEFYRGEERRPRRPANGLERPAYHVPQPDGGAAA